MYVVTLECFPPVFSYNLSPEGDFIPLHPYPPRKPPISHTCPRADHLPGYVLLATGEVGNTTPMGRGTVMPLPSRADPAFAMNTKR